MIRSLRLAALPLVLACAAPAFAEPTPEHDDIPIVNVRDTDPKMNAAIAAARKTCLLYTSPSPRDS